MIRVWQSFSCNNSSSSRLIARFDDAETAREAAAELAEFFTAQEQLADHRHRAGPLATLARTYGFDWADYGAGGEGPRAHAEDTVVIVSHPYCLGLGPGVPAFLVDRGGRPEAERSGSLHLSVLFRAAPGTDPRLDDELAALFAQPVDADRLTRRLAGPWVRAHTAGSVAWFRDAGTVGLWFPIAPEDLPGFRSWLAGHAIEHVAIAIEQFGDEALFAALASARCTACDGLLEYLDPRLHDIETPQLVCGPCGGLYELAAFLPAESP